MCPSGATCLYSICNIDTSDTHNIHDRSPSRLGTIIPIINVVESVSECYLKPTLSQNDNMTLLACLCVIEFSRARVAQ
jgi:hypothetical protein